MKKTFKKFTAVLAGCCVLFAGCGVANESETDSSKEASKKRIKTAASLASSGLSPQEQLARLTLRQKIAQMIIATPDSLAGASGVTSAGEDVTKTIAELPVGGILFEADNLSSKAQLEAALRNINCAETFACGVCAIPTISERGGAASPAAKKLGTPAIDSQSAYGESLVPSKTKTAGETVGDALADIGFKLDLAPNANLWDDDPYSSDPNMASKMVANMAQGLESKGVYAAVISFPGTESLSGRSIDQLRKAEFAPFKAAIEAGVSFVGMGNQKVSGFSEGLPSTLSANAVSVLREELGFNGVIISGRLDDPDIAGKFDSAEAAAAAVEAGVDMLFCPADLEAAVDAIEAAVKSGEISEERIDESVLRILSKKKKMKLF